MNVGKMKTVVETKPKIVLAVMILTAVNPTNKSTTTMPRPLYLPVHLHVVAVANANCLCRLRTMNDQCSCTSCLDAISRAC